MLQEKFVLRDKGFVRFVVTGTLALVVVLSLVSCVVKDQRTSALEPSQNRTNATSPVEERTSSNTEASTHSNTKQAKVPVFELEPEVTGNSQEKKVTPNSKNSVGPIIRESELFSFFSGGKVGYIDVQGRVIIPPTWTSAGKFSDGLARIRSEQGKWGFIDTQGKIVIPPTFEQVLDFHDGKAGAKENNLWGLVDKTGKWVVSPTYQRIYSYSENSWNFRSDKKKMGLIDPSGKVIIMAKYDHISPFKQGWAIAKQNGNWFFVDRKGSVVFDPVGDIAWEFSEGVTPIRRVVGKRGKRSIHRWGYIDRAGKIVIPPKFVRARSFSNGLAAVEPDPKLGFKWGYIDKSGKIRIPPKWKITNSFSENLAVVQVADKYGYIDRRGKIVIPTQFDWATDFENGLAQVEFHTCSEKDREPRSKRCLRNRVDTVGYINKRGEFVLKPVTKR